VDGFELPEIMKWLKQAFAQRFNGMDGRIGHVWGDRYWSEIVDGEPPEEEGDMRVRPLYGEMAETDWLLLFFLLNPSRSPHSAVPRPGQAPRTAPISALTVLHAATRQGSTGNLCPQVRVAGIGQSRQNLTVRAAMAPLPT
jgi:hypothetical protein